MLVFAIAGRTRCADVDDVREIVPIAPTIRLPGAPPFVRGLINLRGTLVTVIDAAKYLYGVPAEGPEASVAEALRLLAVYLAHAWFRVTSKGFADVL